MSFSDENSVMAPGRRHLVLNFDEVLDERIRYLYVSGPATLVVEDEAGVQIPYQNVSGEFVFRPKRIISAGSDNVQVIGIF